MKTKKTNFLQVNYNSLLNSFKKINSNIAFMAFYDLLFYSITYFLALGSFRFLEKMAASVNLPANFLALDAMQATEVLSSLKNFFYLLIFIAITLILLLILNWSLFKGLSWSLAAGKKFNFAFFKKFALLNLVWLGSIILLIFLVALGFKQSTLPVFLLAIFLVSVYFTNILYALFAQESSFKAIKKAFILGFAKIHYFIFPYAAAGLILYGLSKLLSLFAMPQKIYIEALILAFTIYTAWFRLYIVETVNSIKSGQR